MNNQHTQLLETFLQDRKLCGYRDINGTRNQTGRLFRYLEEKELTPSDVGVSEAQSYQGWLLDSLQKNGSTYAPGTVRNFLKGALIFYDFLKKQGHTADNPFREIHRQRVPQPLPRHILKEKEMAQLLEAFANYNEVKGTRNKRVRYRMHVLCELLYSTGMRISEAALLQEEDIDLDRGTMDVKDAKTGQPRTVFLNPYARQVLALYLNNMKELVLETDQNKTLIFGAKPNRLLTLLNRELKTITEELNLPCMTSHGFRHAVGYHFLRSGCDIRYIQEILGHKNIRNTEIYTKVDKEALSQVLDQYHPRQWRAQP